MDPLDLDFSLSDGLDADLLDSLFDSASGTELHVEFRVPDLVVAVRKGENDEISIHVQDCEI